MKGWINEKEKGRKGDERRYRLVWIEKKRLQKYSNMDFQSPFLSLLFNKQFKLVIRPSKGRCPSIEELLNQTIGFHLHMHRWPIRWWSPNRAYPSAINDRQNFPSLSSWADCSLTCQGNSAADSQHFPFQHTASPSISGAIYKGIQHMNAIQRGNWAEISRTHLIFEPLEIGAIAARKNMDTLHWNSLASMASGSWARQQLDMYETEIEDEISYLLILINYGVPPEARDTFVLWDVSKRWRMKEKEGSGAVAEGWTAGSRHFHVRRHVNRKMPAINIWRRKRSPWWSNVVPTRKESSTIDRKD